MKVQRRITFIIMADYLVYVAAIKDYCIPPNTVIPIECITFLIKTK